MNLVERVTEHVRGVPIFTQSGQTFASMPDDATPDSYGDYLATSNDVYATAWLRAKMLAKLPWQVFRTDGSAFETHALLDLLERPNPFFTDLRFKAHLELCMAIWGQVFVTVERSNRGVPKELWPVKPSLMRPRTHQKDFISGYDFFPPGGGKAVPFDLDEVIWIAYPDPREIGRASSRERV